MKQLIPIRVPRSKISYITRLQHDLTLAMQSEGNDDLVLYIKGKIDAYRKKQNDYRAKKNEVK